MPRERVHHGALLVHTPISGDDQTGSDNPVTGYSIEEYHPDRDLPEGATIHEQPSLEVAWDRDASWVQVGFHAPREWYEKALSDTAFSSFTAYTEVLTRAELNHMIRTLRRARDAAYGADA